MNATSLHKTETEGAAFYKTARRISVLVCTDNLLLVSYGSNTEISSTDLLHCNKRYNRIHVPQHLVVQSAYGWYAHSAQLCMLNAVA